jgi:hypothetical protein
MQSTTNPKEPIMQATATQRLVRLAAVLAPAATIAAICGHPGWSDENLKQQIQPIQHPLDRIRAL